MKRFSSFIFLIVALSMPASNVVGQINTQRIRIDGNIDGGYWTYVVDFDKDGDEDILASAIYEGLHWYKNDGAGNFTHFNIDPSFLGAWSVHANDFDGDGDLDVVACSDELDQIAWFIRDGDDSFKKRIIEEASPNLNSTYSADVAKAGLEPHSIYSADLDNDGDFDVMAALWGSNEVVGYYNDNSGNFSRIVIDSNFKSGHSIHAADMDNDGDIDILAGGSSETALYRQRSDGTFRTFIIASFGAFSVSAVDINQDGLLDVIRNQRPDGDQDINWLENLGNSQFKTNVVEDNYGESWSQVATDLDSDGDIDIVAAGFVPNKVSYWLNDGNENFSEVVLDDNVTRPRGTALGDFDKDGDKDIVVITRDNDDLYWYQVAGSPGPQNAVTVVSPNGGETLEAGSTTNISWTFAGAVDSVNIEYSTDNGVTWISVARAAANNSPYNWTTPRVTTKLGRIKISDADNPLVLDVSDRPFDIEIHTITISSPNGGETLKGGEIVPISWNSSGTINNVAIDYSLDAGQTWSSIVNSTPNDGNYNWQIVDAQTSTGLVRLYDVADGNPADTSDAFFSIVGSVITVASPNGGETWASGSVSLISWMTTGAVQTVNIDYSLDNGANWISIVKNFTNTNQYVWTLPAVETATALVRVSDASDGQPVDQSDASFWITASSLTITAPNGGETWFSGNQHQISWQYSGDISFVSIEYSSDNGANWGVVVSVAPNTGSFVWQIPAISAQTALIRVTNIINGAPQDVSDAVFSIAGAGLSLTTPNGGETYFPGTAQDIKWNTIGQVGFVRLSFYYDNDSLLIAERAPNDGSYSWVVPNIQTTTGRIQISDADNKTSYDFSDNSFSIKKSQLTVTSPNGGENWQGGSVGDITWTTQGTLDSVRIEYSTDNGASWGLVVASVENTGSYSWLLPNTVSLSTLVKVSQASFPAVNDVSDNIFIILSSSLTLTTPNGGEIWGVGSQQRITWNTTGFINSVNLDYSNDNGGTWVSIVTATDNTGLFEWLIPDFDSKNMLLRVSNAGGGYPQDMSDNYFTIGDNPTGIKRTDGEIPEDFALMQNYPNPFNMGTKIDFSVPKAANVRLDVYNMRGMLIRTLYNQQFAAGKYSAAWFGLDAKGQPSPSGVYIYRIRIGEWKSARRLLLLK